jgi:hypothetical protein
LQWILKFGVWLRTQIANDASVDDHASQKFWLLTFSVLLFALGQRWVSVTGLIDTPYTSDRYNYTHVGITVTADGQVQFISEADANYRLGRASAPTQQNNQDVLRNLGAAARPATPKGLSPGRSANASTKRTEDQSRHSKRD